MGVTRSIIMDYYYPLIRPTKNRTTITTIAIISTAQNNSTKKNPTPRTAATSISAIMRKSRRPINYCN